MRGAMRRLALLATAIGALILFAAYGLFRVELAPATANFPISHAVIARDDPAFGTFLGLAYAGWILTFIGATFTTSVGWVRALGVLAALSVLLLGAATLITSVAYGVALGAALAYARPAHRLTIATLAIASVGLVLSGTLDSVVGQPIGGWRILAETLGPITFFSIIGFFSTARLRDRQLTARPASS
jgi:hypothetical protein